MKNKVVMTYSAGIDSVYILTKLASTHNSVHLLHIDFGHPASKNERIALHKQIADFEQLFPNCTFTKHFLSLTEYNKIAREYISSGYVTHNFTKDNIKEDLFFPARNALLASSTFFLAQTVSATSLVCPFTPAIHYTNEELPDLGPNIMSLYKHLGEIYHINIIYPYGWHIEIDDDSVTIRDLIYNIGLNETKHMLNLTYSCLKGATPPCGTCVNCLRRTNVIERVAKL